MRRASVTGVIVVFLLISGSAAAQQRRATGAGPVPAEGMNAIGVQIGAAMPADPTLDHGLVLTAMGEHYFSERNSVRGAISSAWFDISGHSFTGTVNPVAFSGNVVHNWEGGAWHPYATVGAGLYHYKFTDGGLATTNNKFGINLGGGVEYFVTRRDTFLGELLFHVIPGDDVVGNLATYQNRYWTLSGGYKKYF